MNGFKVFTGNSNPELAKQICAHLNLPLGKAQVKDFSDGEIDVEILESVRGVDVYVIQSTSNPAAKHLVELLVIADALMRASVKSITVVMPYYGYARQERKGKKRKPITASLIARLLQQGNIHRLMCIEIHAGAIQGFFNCPMDHLYTSPVLIPELEKLRLDKPVILSPDAGGMERAVVYARKLGGDPAMIYKKRSRANQSEALAILGDVNHRVVVIVDDMIDTAGSLVNAAKLALGEGAEKVFACATHAVFSGPAISRITASPIEKVIVTNTIQLSSEALACEKIQCVSVAELIATGMDKIYNRGSITSMFPEHP